ncbi:tetratricopeptide repeat protein [Micromonospora sp. WMMD1274]|uniref:tetratricopeptide repeat protein n=1 Tax=Micromonospora sp. WMMD1274 TaxID=3404116 RepID=UPI003B950AB6
MDQPRLRFLGIGVSRYQHGHCELPAARREIATLSRMLDGEPLIDPSEEDVRRRLRTAGPDPRPRVLAWSGHAAVVDGDLRLLAADSTTGYSAGLPLREIVLQLADSGTTQLLVIVDACLAGSGAVRAVETALHVFDRRSVTDQPMWAGVLASCRPWENAVDGVFGRRLIRLLRRGPVGRVARLSWSRESEYVTGDAVGDAVQRAFRRAAPAQQPVFARVGLAGDLLRNPLFTPHVHPVVSARGVDLVLAGRDGPVPDAARRDAEAAVLGWIEAARPGLYLLTGPTGSGKSAVVAHVVNEAAVGRVDAYVSARARTADQVRDELGPAPRVVVVDGLDEAGPHAADIVAKVLVPLAVESCVVVATRDPAGLGRPAGRVDLDAPDRRQPAPADLDPVLAALSYSYGAGFPEQEWIVVADAIAPAGVTVGRRDVLRTLERHGRHVVQDSEAGTTVYRLAREVRFPHPARNTAVAVALLGRYRRLIAGGVPADQPTYLWEHGWRHAAEGGDLTLAAFRELTTAAPALRTALAHAELEHSAALRAQGERGAAVTHAERAVDLLDDGPFLASARNNLAVRYRDAGRPGRAAEVCALAVGYYRRARADVSDLAGTLNNLAVCLVQAGQPEPAVAAAAEAVELYRSHPAYRIDLAMCLTSLSLARRRAGDARAARDAATEAVGIYAEVEGAEASRAGALSGLSESLRALSTPDEEPAAEAVELLRVCVAEDPAMGPHLAAALAMLADCRLDLGRPEAAVPAAREAVTRWEEAGPEPYFRTGRARAGTVLSAALLAAGEIEAALDAAVEAAAGDQPEALNQLALCRHAAEDVAGAEAAAERTVAMAPLEATGWNTLSVTALRRGRISAAVAAGRRAVARASDDRVRAAALTNLGVAHQAAGRPAAAAEAFAAAVALRPPGSPQLAAALDRLVAVLLELPGREAETVEAAARAVESRPSASATALVRLAWAHFRTGDHDAALAAAKQAAERDADGAHAVAGYALRALGRDDLAASRFDEAIRRYEQCLPEQMDELAQVLAVRGSTDATWAGLTARYPAQALVSRAAVSVAGDPRAAGWLAEAARHGADPAALHPEARRHRAADASLFDRAWPTAPDWLTVDAGLLETARQWAVSNTPEFLRDHPELLDAGAAVAVREACLTLPAAEAAELAELRAAAAEIGADRAYRRRCCRDLAQRFVVAGPTGKRDMLSEEPLRDADCRELVAGRDASAAALLDLAARDAARPVLDALGEPRSELVRVLAGIAGRDDRLIGPAAVIAGSAADPLTAHVLAAMAALVEGRPAGSHLAAVARSLPTAPDGGWRVLAHAAAVVVGRHPAVLPVLLAVTADQSVSAATSSVA